MPRRAARAHGAAALPAALSDYQPHAATIRLFNPNRLLAVVAVLFWPLRFSAFVLAPAVFLAGLTMFKHWHEMTMQLHLLLGEFSFIVHMLFSLIIINLGARLAMGAAVRAAGGAVREFGFIFFMGVIPRFYIDRSAIPRLDRTGQLWAYGAPLMARLGFFACGVLAWATYRSNGTWAANLALLVSQAGLWSFLFASIPFMPGDGYNWLAIYFRQPMLRQKALVALSAKLRGKRLPPVIRAGEAPVLLFFAICAIFTVIAASLVILSFAAVLLTKQLQGIGAVLFLAFAAGFIVWLFRFKAMRQQPEQQRIRVLRAFMAGQSAAAAPKSAPASPQRTRQKIVWAVAGLVVILVSFLPYSYEPAGPFEILPQRSSLVIAQSDGQVMDVLVREGEWVNAGQVLGHLSSASQQRDVALTREDLADAEKNLAQIRESGSSSDQETVEQAQAEVDRLRLQVDSDEAQLERTVMRAPSAGFVTTPNPRFLTGAWLNAGDKFLQIDDTKTVEAQIEIPQDEIAFVKTGAAVRLRPWSERDREVAGRVISVAPTALDEADGNVPADVKKVAPPSGGNPGSRVVFSRDPDAAVADEGARAGYGDEPAEDAATLRRRVMMRRERVRNALNKSDISGAIRVSASVPNTAMVLRPGITGYAKISGPAMTLGEACIRRGVRFVTIELWSWIP